MLNAFWRVAPSVRLSALAILRAGVLFFAKVFSSRTCAELQAILFRAFFGIYKSPILEKRDVIALSDLKRKQAGVWPGSIHNTSAARQTAG